MVKGKFSVVIPTLQRSPELWPLVDQLAAHPLVQEVLVINNAPEPLSWGSPKVRVLQQAENIYVNPAWNLGAREARGEYLAIVNDDVRFGDEVLTLVARALRAPFVGVIGASASCFTSADRRTSALRLRPVFERPPAFGVVMFLRRKRYVEIPDELRVFCGDDWLFQAQTVPNLVITGAPMRTEMSTTSSGSAFDRIKDSDVRWAHANGVLDGPYRRRFVRASRVLRAARLLRRTSD